MVVMVIYTLMICGGAKLPAFGVMEDRFGNTDGMPKIGLP